MFPFAGADYDTNTVTIHVSGPASIRHLQLQVDTWRQGLPDAGGYDYCGVDLLELLGVEINLSLRERWFGGLERPPKAVISTFVRGTLARWYPSLLFKLERARVTGGSGSTGERVSDGCRVLAVVQGPTDSDLGTLLPLIREARRRGASVTIATADVGASRRLELLKLVYRNLLLPTGPVDEYVSMGRRLHRNMSAGARLGAGMLREMQRFGVFELVVRRAMLAMQALENIIPILAETDVVVVASDVHLIGKAAVLAANARAIRTVVVQNGMYGEGPDAVTLGFLPVVARTVCAWSEAAAGILRAHGIAADRIEITGQPRFDGLCTIDPAASRSELGKALTIPVGARVVTFVSQNVFRRREQLEILASAFHAVIDAVPDAFVVVKLHPSESPHLWHAVFGNPRRGCSVAVTNQVAIHAVLAASDVVITSFSTAGLEALALNRPLIVLTDLERASELKYVEFDAALPATVSSLADRVRMALDDAQARNRLAEGAQRFLRQYAGAVDGASTERVIDVLLKERIAEPVIA